MGTKARMPLKKSRAINDKIVKRLRQDPNYDRSALATEVKLSRDQVYQRIYHLRNRGELPAMDGETTPITGAAPRIILGNGAPKVELPPASSKTRKITKIKPIKRRSEITRYAAIVDSMIKMDPPVLQAAVSLLDQLDELADEELTQRALDTARALVSR